MKKWLLLSMLAVASPAYSWEDQENPGTEPEDPQESPLSIMMRERHKAFTEAVHYLRTSPEHAGSYADLQVPGIERVIVDRRSEATAGKKAAPQRIESLETILKTLNADARGGLKVSVHRTYYEDGTLKDEKYDFSFDAQWHIGQGAIDEGKAKVHE